jgi:hypothetical protein
MGKPLPQSNQWSSSLEAHIKTLRTQYDNTQSMIEGYLERIKKTRHPEVVHVDRSARVVIAMCDAVYEFEQSNSSVKVKVGVTPGRLGYHVVRLAVVDKPQ